MEALATHSASRRTRTAHAGNRGGRGKTSPQAYGDSGIAATAMVPLPKVLACWPPVLRGRLLHHIACEASALVGESRIRHVIGHFAASGSVASDDLGRSVGTCGGDDALGIMMCRA